MAPAVAEPPAPAPRPAPAVVEAPPAAPAAVEAPAAPVVVPQAPVEPFKGLQTRTGAVKAVGFVCHICGCSCAASTMGGGRRLATAVTQLLAVQLQQCAASAIAAARSQQRAASAQGCTAKPILKGWHGCYLSKHAMSGRRGSRALVSADMLCCVMCRVPYHAESPSAASAAPAAPSNGLVIGGGVAVLAVVAAAALANGSSSSEGQAAAAPAAPAAAAAPAAPEGVEAAASAAVGGAGESANPSSKAE